MPSSKPGQQILWGGATSKTLNAATAFISDNIDFNIEDWDVAIQISAQNQSTPQSGDVVNVGLLYTTGKILRGASNDYDTTKGAIPIGRLNTYASDVDGENPQIRTFPDVSTAPLGVKLVLTAPNAATRNILINAWIVTHRGQ